MAEFLPLWWVFPASILLGAVPTAVAGALEAEPVWTVVGWSIPGVLIGSTLGSRVGQWLPAERMEKILGGVFAAVGLLMLAMQLAG